MVHGADTRVTGGQLENELAEDQELEEEWKITSMASKDSDQETKDMREREENNKGEAKMAEGGKSEDQTVISVTSAVEDKKTDSKKSAESEHTVPDFARMKVRTSAGQETRNFRLVVRQD